MAFMHNYTVKNNVTHLFDLAFNSERSIEDELERETTGDIPTIGVSYGLMVFYIVLALGRISSWKKFFIEGKLSLSLTGVVLVLISVGASIGMFGFFQGYILQVALKNLLMCRCSQGQLQI